MENNSIGKNKGICLSWLEERSIPSSLDYRMEIPRDLCGSCAVGNHGFARSPEPTTMIENVPQGYYGGMNLENNQMDRFGLMGYEPLHYYPNLVSQDQFML